MRLFRVVSFRLWFRSWSGSWCSPCSSLPLALGWSLFRPLCLALLLAQGCDQSAGLDAPGDGGDNAAATDNGRGHSLAANPASMPRFAQDPIARAESPPPISGGTLIVLRDKGIAVAADPDRDRVYVADLDRRRLSFSVSLPAGSEPGRVAEGAAGRVHVVLRRRGTVIAIDSATGLIVGEREVCAAPRGVAYDAGKARLWVACVDGTLAWLPEDGVGGAHRFVLPDDLRDVVVAGPSLFVSRFRSAQVLMVDAATGRVQRSLAVFQPGTGTVGVAWRMMAGSGGGVVVAHQLALTKPVAKDPGGYAASASGGCSDTVVESVLTSWSGDGTMIGSSRISNLTLPVDLAFGVSNVRIAVATPANYKSAVGGMGVLLRTSNLSPYGNCATGEDMPARVGQATSVAAYGADFVFQTREPAALYLSDAKVSIPLSADSREDTGHAIFHNRAGINLACASCHPEGGEDGRVWEFAGVGARRTQALRGGILATAPFHWDGALPTIADVAHDVYNQRMGGPTLEAPQSDCLGHFINGIGLLPTSPAANPSSVARGKAIFEGGAAGCASCHNGPRLTDNRTVDVGSGGHFQVPSLLGLWARAPYLHDGCAATLADRFGKCAPQNNAHGNTAHLSPADITDLVAYLGTL